MIMKTVKIFSYLSLAALLLHSCYKEDPIPQVELSQFMQLALIGAHDNPNVLKINLASARDTTFTISMKYGGTNNYNRGLVTAEIGVDESLVAAYNSEHGTQYLLLPANTYSLNKTVLTIDDGSNLSDELKLTLKTLEVNYLNEYILPITIKSVTGGNVPASEEYKTVYLLFTGELDDAGTETWTKLDASSEWQAAYPVKNVFDGDDGTYWHSDLTGLPQWFSIDMGSYRRIDGFTYNNRKDQGQNALPKHLLIETSMNGSDWQTALDIAELPQSRLRQVLQLPQAVIARYLRVTILSTWNDATYSYIAELSTYSGEGPAEEEVFELTVDSYSSYWAAGWEPSNLIDGNKDTPWHTALTGMPQWVIFDMAKSHTVRGFKIWNRQGPSAGDHGSEPKHITFELSDDKTSWTTLIDEEEFSNDYSKELDLKAPAAKKGQYLRLTVLSTWNAQPYTYLGEITPY